MKLQMYKSAAINQDQRGFLSRFRRKLCKLSQWINKIQFNKSFKSKNKKSPSVSATFWYQIVKILGKRRILFLGSIDAKVYKAFCELMIIF